MSIEAMKQALEALECLFGIPEQFTGKGGGDVAVWTLGGSYRAQQAITALRQAIDAASQLPEAEPSRSDIKQEPVPYTTGHCKEKAQPNGCQLHNLHCGYPACDRKALVNPQPKRAPLTNENPLLVFAKECVLGAYREDELADAAQRAIKAAHGIKK